MSDWDRFSDEYDPEPDYDRPTRAEAEADAREDEKAARFAQRYGVGAQGRKFSEVINPRQEGEPETVSADPTESIRREMISTGQPAADLAATDQSWTTEEATAIFEFIGFMAPFVVVRRRSDGKKGSLEFANGPEGRRYFGWSED